jgi:hypothetical protein
MKIKTKVGTFHLHNIEKDNEIWQVCDSDNQFIANLYSRDSLKYFLDYITNINHITDICDFGGLVENMIFGNTKRETAINTLDYFQEEKSNWDGEEWNYNEEDIVALSEYVNRVGDIYFIVDYNDL